MGRNVVLLVGSKMSRESFTWILHCVSLSLSINLDKCNWKHFQRNCSYKCVQLSHEVSRHGAALPVLLLPISHHGTHLLLQQLREVLEEPLLVILQLLGLPLGPPLLDVGGLLTHHQVCMRIILVVVRL